jgi:hypothetical protein
MRKEAVVAPSEVMYRFQSLEADEKNHKIYITGVKKVHLHVKCPIFSPTLTKFEFSPQIILKISNVKFHKNPSSGSCKDTSGWKESTD